MVVNVPTSPAQCRRTTLKSPKIKQLYLLKGYGARRLVKEFPGKKWQVRSVGRLLKKLQETGTTSRQAGSGRPRRARTQENVDAVGDLVLSNGLGRNLHAGLYQPDFC